MTEINITSARFVFNDTSVKTLMYLNDDTYKSDFSLSVSDSPRSIETNVPDLESDQNYTLVITISEKFNTVSFGVAQLPEGSPVLLHKVPIAFSDLIPDDEMGRAIETLKAQEEAMSDFSVFKIEQTNMARRTQHNVITESLTASLEQKIPELILDPDEIRNLAGVLRLTARCSQEFPQP